MSATICLVSWEWGEGGQPAQQVYYIPRKRHAVSYVLLNCNTGGVEFLVNDRVPVVAVRSTGLPLFLFLFWRARHLCLCVCRVCVFFPGSLRLKIKMET